MAMFTLARISGHTFIVDTLNDSSVVFDLGANHGEFSREILRQFNCKQILAVEPTPNLVTKLSKIEGLGVRQCVVNGSGKQVIFRVDTGNSESSSIVAEPADEGCLMVQGATLTELVGNHQKVDLVKMDVEGAEIDILKTTPDEVLRRVKQLTVEFHDFKHGSGVTSSDVVAVFKRMRAMGFRVFVNSFWTYGDVLFVNTALIPIGRIKAASMAISGRWWPGMKRVANRLGSGP